MPTTFKLPVNNDRRTYRGALPRGHLGHQNDRLGGGDGGSSRHGLGGRHHHDRDRTLHDGRWGRLLTSRLALRGDGQLLRTLLWGDRHGDVGGVALGHRAGDVAHWGRDIGDLLAGGSAHGLLLAVHVVGGYDVTGHHVQRVLEILPVLGEEVVNGAVHHAGTG